MEHVDIHGMRCEVCRRYVRVGYGTDNGLWVYCDNCKMAWTFEEVIIRTALDRPRVLDEPDDPRSN